MTFQEYICIMIFLTLSSRVVGGNEDSSNGIYLTEKDFSKDVLTYPSLHDRDSLIEEWGGDISLVRNGTKIRFTFGEFYGYRDRGFKFFSFGKEQIFRLHGYFQVLDTSWLSVYSKRIPHVMHKYVEAPYFSVRNSEAKHKLVVRKLKKLVPLSRATLREIRSMRKDGTLLHTLVDGRCAVNLVILKSLEENL